MNKIFAEHVTNTAFFLSISKRQRPMNNELPPPLVLQWRNVFKTYEDGSELATDWITVSTVTEP